MLKEEELVEPIKKYYIAYFDILGYKGFFETYPDKVEIFLKSINEAVKDVIEYKRGVNSSHTLSKVAKMSIRTKFFSDNILLCLEVTNNPLECSRVLTFMSILADLQRLFILKYNIFLRGGITLGDLSFNEDNDKIVFGQGLIDVVSLEEKAEYPRIIIGKDLMDYVSQICLVESKDFERACKIEKRICTGEKVSDDECGFYNTICFGKYKENFYSKWRDALILKTDDDAGVLNYLYYFEADNVVDQNTMGRIYENLKNNSPDDFQTVERENKLDIKQVLEQHRPHVMQKINEFGTYDDLDKSAIEGAKQREHILKKYIWVANVHNNECEKHNL